MSLKQQSRKSNSRKYFADAEVSGHFPALSVSIWMYAPQKKRNSSTSWLTLLQLVSPRGYALHNRVSNMVINQLLAGMVQIIMQPSILPNLIYLSL